MSTQNIPMFVKGDINGFFGLFTNSLTNIMTALGLSIVIGMPADIVFTKIAPALVLAVGIGNLYMGYAAKKLADKTNNPNVTALPYGVSVPHYFVVNFVVVAGVVGTLKASGYTGDIWATAWGVGAAWSFVQGVIMLAGAVVGPFLQHNLPKGTLLGSLAGLALTFIAMSPMATVFSHPLVGMTSLAILVVGWLANKHLPFNLPAGLLAIIIGTILGWSMGLMDVKMLVDSTSMFGFAMPDNIWGDFLRGFSYLLPFLPAAIPLGIYDFLESLDNVESAHVAGEPYHTAEMLVIPAVMTIITAPIGNIFPMIIYIGHPGWKAAGARIGYSFMTGIGVILLGFIGGLAIIGRSIPLVALVPILAYIATVIGKQAFGTVNKKYYPALILGLMPFVASFMMLQINTLLGSLGTSVAEVASKTTVPLLGYQTFGSADILVSMMLIAITMSAIDRNFMKASIFCLISAVLSYFGFIHATAFNFSFYIPSLATHVLWGYLGMGLIFIIAHFFESDKNVEPADE